MAKWFRLSQIPPFSKNNFLRIRQFKIIELMVDNAIHEYLTNDNYGIEVVVAVARMITIRGLKSKYFKEISNERFAQDLGLYVAYRLAVLFTPERVMSWRSDNGKNISTRRVKADLDWMQRYSPYRILPNEIETTRVILDANIIRNIVQLDDTAISIESLVDQIGDAQLSIADIALGELLLAVIEDRVELKVFNRAVNRLDLILDPVLPIAPSGIEATAISKFSSDVCFDKTELFGYYQAIWAFVKLIKSKDDFKKSVIYELPDGRRFAIGSLEKNILQDVMLEKKNGLQEFLKKVIETAPTQPDMSDEDYLEEMKDAVRIYLGISMSKKILDHLDLFISCLCYQAMRVVRFNAKIEAVDTRNNAVDLELLYLTCLPAVLCTNDNSLKIITKNSGSVDSRLVIGSEDLPAWLAALAAKTENKHNISK